MIVRSAWMTGKVVPLTRGSGMVIGEDVAVVPRQRRFACGRYESRVAPSLCTLMTAAGISVGSSMIPARMT